MELAIRNIVYSCKLFKEMNSNGFFHVSENYQHHLIYWPLHPELFFTGESVTFYFVVFLTQAHSGRPIFSPFVNIFFLLKHAFT